jgi:uncharacterized membrane protein
MTEQQEFESALGFYRTLRDVTSATETPRNVVCGVLFKMAVQEALMLGITIDEMIEFIGINYVIATQFEPESKTKH